MRFVIAALALITAHPALAQTGAAPSAPPSGRPADRGAGRWPVTLGVAPVASPAWQGSRDMTLSLVPDIRINYREVIFASIPEGLGGNVLNHDGWKAGPLAKIRFGRDERWGGSPFLITGGSDSLQGLGDVGAAVEVGGFIEKTSRSLRTRVEVRRGFWRV